MAKKITKSVKSSLGGAVPSPVDAPFKPRLYLQMEGKDVKQLKELSVGEEVEFLVRGKVVGINQRQRTAYDDSKRTINSGDVDLENYSVELVENESNEFSQLAEEDENE